MKKQLSLSVEAALLHALWHHQGGSSKTGQPIRHMLGIGRHDRLTDEQVQEAKRVQSALAKKTEVPVAEVCNGVLRWHIPAASYSVDTRLLTGIHMLYAAQQPPAEREPDMRAVCEVLGFDPTNHHNAAKCPYCTSQQPAEREPLTDEQIKRLRNWFITEWEFHLTTKSLKQGIEAACGIGVKEPQA